MKRETLQGWLLVLPAVILLAAFTHWPTVETLWASLHTTAVPGHPSRFAPATNLQTLWEDTVFWQALRNNLVYAGCTIPATMALSLVMALVVDRHLPGRGLLRLAYFTPTILPMIAVANIWLYFFTPGYGLFDKALAPFGLGELQLVRQFLHRAARDHCHRDLEGGRLLHDLLPGGAADRCRRICARPRRWRVPRVGHSSAAWSGRC